MRAALVTGGSRGIGFEIGRYLVAEGFALVICDIRSEEDAYPALNELRDAGATVVYVQGDVGDPDSRQDLVRTIRSELGCLHVLVNNAGIGPRQRADILVASEMSFVEVMRTNLQGPYFLTQACALWMIEQKAQEDSWSGCIVNISSVSATVASTSRGEYCISKAGVSMATKLWASRLGEFGIPVYEVRPGIIRTSMTEAVEERYTELIKNGLTIQRRWGTPDDVGRAVAALVRGDLPYCTGQVVDIDGGMTVQRL
jgi:NAD(P)-dependent dehydrogenase (short-subunit alcohol dehydrogenase family)